MRRTNLLVQPRRKQAEPLTPEEIEVRFWSKVEKLPGDHACWLWKDAPASDGYGKFRIGKKKVRAHRFSWELVNGPIPDGMQACHNCPDGDNPMCIRPDHLFLGTPAVNSADMVSKDRQAKGDRHGTRVNPQSVRRGESAWNARLTQAQVDDIRATIKTGPGVIAAIAKRAEEIGVSPSAVSLVVYGRSWREHD